MTKATTFRVIVRVVFIFAFCSFMLASLRHVATFFHNFEPEGSDWLNSYMLATSIDLTALILTVGVMFFRAQMPWYAQVIVWFFIAGLTAFSWTVNWEYAILYQSADMKSDATLALINPILASSFAALNLAYAIVSEFFNAKVVTADELAKEVDRLEALQTQQNRLRELQGQHKKPSLIQRAKDIALETKQAVKEVVKEPEKDVQNITVLRSEQREDDLEKTLDFLATRPAATDEELAQFLGKKRPASARFWRLKANEILERERAQKMEAFVEPTTDPLTPIVDVTDGRNDGTETEDEMEEEVSVDIPQSGTNETQKAEAEHPQARKFSRRKPMTVAEVAVELECTERRVRELRLQGVLKSADEEKKLISSASVKSYLATRQRKGRVKVSV